MEETIKEYIFIIIKDIEIVIVRCIEKYTPPFQKRVKQNILR